MSDYDPRNTCKECGVVLPMQQGGWYINGKGPICIDCFIKEEVIQYTEEGEG